MNSDPKYIRRNPGAYDEQKEIHHETLMKFDDERDRYVPMVECSWEPLCHWPVVHRWDGWDSLLINNWRGRASQLHTFTTVDRKPKRKRSRAFLSKCENPESSTKKDFKVLQKYYHLHSLVEGSPRDVMDIVTNCVAFTAHDFMERAFSDPSVIEPLGDKFNNFYKRVFKIFVKFVLDVFDLEDIMLIDRFYAKWPMLENEYLSLYNRLSNTSEVTFNDINTVRKSVSELSKGKHLSDALHLTEREVGYVLENHFRLNSTQETLLLGGDLICAIENMCCPYAEVDEKYKRWTRRVMKSYVPLKEDTKVQLALELMKDKCYFVTDALYVEMIRSINLIEFVPHNCDSLKNDCPFTEIVFRIKEQVHNCFSRKKDLLLLSEMGALFPLMCGIFLPCESDVIEVVKIANHERMMQDHRFISLRHILCGLSMTEYAEAAKKILPRFDEQERAKFPIYGIYQSADERAKKKCYPVLKLENLADAVFEACQTHLSMEICYLSLTGVTKFDEGWNNKQDDKTVISSVENRWSTLITKDDVKKIVKVFPAFELAKLLDEKHPTRFIIPEIRRSVP